MKSDMRTVSILRERKKRNGKRKTLTLSFKKDSFLTTVHMCKRVKPYVTPG